MFRHIGVGELSMVLFNVIPLVVIPAILLWLSWRAVRALEGIAQALRERK